MSNEIDNKAKLVWITPGAESVIGYCARVSNPNNQENPEVEKLLKYCFDNGHWSVFETANMCVEINTTRGIAPQILRHRSFTFQEFSGRYADYNNLSEYPFEEIEPRAQDNKNRQNSTDSLTEEQKKWFKKNLKKLEDDSLFYYDEALKAGIAKECARFLLPMSVKTRLYMNGTIRSWIHYLLLRMKKSTQLEHRVIAESVFDIFVKEMPTVGKFLSAEIEKIREKY